MNWEQAKRLVAARDGGNCVRCLGEAVDVHHRRPRAMGGTSRPEIAVGLANLICVCRACHDHIHGHPAESYRFGYLVHSFENPLDIPVTVKIGSGRMTLTADGQALVESYALF